MIPILIPANAPLEEKLAWFDAVLWWQQEQGPIVKGCPCCGRGYTQAWWEDLPQIGVKAGLDWRNCPCRSTLALAVHGEAKAAP